MSCANANCNKNALDSMDSILVSSDGDFVCNAQCKAAYERQMNHFFNEIVHSEEKTRAWLMSEIPVEPEVKEYVRED